MKVIETKYKGYYFRSRLEARWAVFFDACGVKWEYEPEGFSLDNGLCYLPDFLLHDVWVRNRYKQDLWVEVKGVMSEVDAEKIKAFNDAGWADDGGYYINRHSILIVSSIPRGDNLCELFRDVEEYESARYPRPFNFGTVDGDDYTGLPCLSPQGHFAIVGGDYWEDIDEEKTVEAYRLARQERFEHKSQPQVSYVDDSTAEYSELSDGSFVSQNRLARVFCIMLAPDKETKIDICQVDGSTQLFVKIARISTAIGYKSPSISPTSPLVNIAKQMNIPTPRFFTKRLSGGESYNTKAYYLAIDDVPKILNRYCEIFCTTKKKAQIKRNIAASELCHWFEFHNWYMGNSLHRP